jgi:hypothetical protein
VGLAGNTRFYFVVSAIDTSGNTSAYSTEASASTNPQQAAGWPNVLPTASTASPILADIDGDNDLEVILGNDRVYAWHHDGQEVRDGDGEALTYGVFSDQGQDFISPIAMAKIDAEFGLDIVAAAWTSKEVYCFTASGAVLPGWPQPTIDKVRASTVVGDIDGDDSPEIIAIDQDARMYAWHSNGTEVRDGDNNPLTPGVFYRFPDVPWWHYQAPCLADIDKDGSDEIIVATQDSMLYVLNGDGTDLPGWPRQLAYFAGGGCAVGDIDNNGDLDILVSVRNSDVMALRPDNTILWLRFFPQNLFFNPNFALADIDDDGTLETFLPSSNGYLFGLASNGADLPGWPVQYSATAVTESSPVIADINGDGVVDVILGNESKFIWAWDITGAPLEGFPLVTGDAMRGTPAIADLDGDGTVEIAAAGSDRTVYVWDLSTPYTKSKSPWPMLNGNWHRSGLYNFIVPTAVGETRAPVESAELDQNYPNPFNPTTTIVFYVPAGTPAARNGVSLIVYDVTGARVRTLLDRPVGPGRHVIEWDGRNDSGSTVGSGVYFYRLVQDGFTATRKMVLLK